MTVSDGSQSAGPATFPSGMVFNEEEWRAIVDLVLERDIHLIYWAMMESILFDDRPLIHPATFEGMRDRTITLLAKTAATAR